MPRINLLPWRDQQRKERRLQFFVALLGAAVFAAIFIFASYLWFGSLIDAQAARNERLQAEIKVLDKQIEEINDLEAQKQRFSSRIEIIEKLQASRPEVVHLFDEITKAMPDGVYLTGLTQTNTHLKFEGVAQSSSRVATLMRNVIASQYLKDPDLDVIQSSKDSPGSSFVLNAEQVTGAATANGGGK